MIKISWTSFYSLPLRPKFSSQHAWNNFRVSLRWIPESLG